MKRKILFECALASLVVAGCYTGAKMNDVNGSAPDAAQTTDPTVPSDSGLPCDVAKLLTDSCTSCHGDPLSGGANDRLMSFDDLVAPSAADPSRKMAEECVARMKDTKRPMPPDALLPAESVAVLEKWIAAGMPKGSCGIDAGSAVETPTVCTSNTMWTRGDRGSSSMHPGVACIDCHAGPQGDDAPSFTLAGTVYPTVHEPDDCYGAKGSISVVVTDANGKVYTLPINSAGNFYSNARIATPYTAKVVSAGKTRAMTAAQTNGDCNTCHTRAGAEKAPGRIFAP